MALQQDPIAQMTTAWPIRNTVIGRRIRMLVAVCENCEHSIRHDPDFPDSGWIHTESGKSACRAAPDLALPSPT